MYNMLARLCEQQAAVGAVLHSRRDLLHLEHSVEWRLIEDLLDILEPFYDATTYLSSSYTICLRTIDTTNVEINASDSQSIQSVKRAISKDLNSRYQNREIHLIINKSSFLDPRMKTTSPIICSTTKRT